MLTLITHPDDEWSPAALKNLQDLAGEPLKHKTNRNCPRRQAFIFTPEQVILMHEGEVLLPFAEDYPEFLDDLREGWK